MRRRWHSTEAQEDESRFSGESSLSEVRLSTDLSQQCRFILLGGDETAKNDACHFILRTPQSQQFQRSNPHSCEKKENCVQGRHVCVTGGAMTLYIQTYKWTQKPEGELLMIP
ncbi:hypothetical protein KOW79_015170 [Hemibagrus wyckioides]|uniref:Uncharacterized protein n=1 Tax=Hemibagrus wyckioides TaxID=337641 RepID=A0A9D3NEN5_9TELE|nr:hypothetical protein KOW79_015170 [Hemibagrus wyckioides]